MDAQDTAGNVVAAERFSEKRLRHPSTRPSQIQEPEFHDVYRRAFEHPQKEPLPHCPRQMQ